MQPEAGEKGKVEGISEEVDLNHAKSKSDTIIVGIP
jgi:hypothetical protein